ncbi:hypothetical protein [Lactobacillus sp. ESL0703]|uniref:hypothetical protein n=1 Tax=Lactobacillus sp. ESL0703 TaxID=2983218 RepID=UPI0023F88DA8|nr:hypothetical protein [Lactobacillus sp. ESL0703]MDF7668231.1 hypothetical protein [Lactobacillus sp. ESL0703]
MILLDKYFWYLLLSCFALILIIHFLEKIINVIKIIINFCIQIKNKYKLLQSAWFWFITGAITIFLIMGFISSWKTTDLSTSSAIMSAIAAFMSAIGTFISAKIAKMSYDKQNKEATRKSQIRPRWFYENIDSKNHKGYLCLCISVLNLSSRPVEINNFGFNEDKDGKDQTNEQEGASPAPMKVNAGWISSFSEPKGTINFVTDACPLLVKPYSSKDFLLYFPTIRNKFFCEVGLFHSFNLKWNWNSKKDYLDSWPVKRIGNKELELILENEGFAISKEEY